VYIDDIIIYSKTREEHEEHLKVVFTLLRNAGLKINLEKCDFFRTRLAFLGHVITIKGIAPDPAKIDKVKGYPVPGDKTNVRAFLGLASYYRRFVKDFLLSRNRYIILRKGTSRSNGSMNISPRLMC
jgi:hypothetical protein